MFEDFDEAQEIRRRGIALEQKVQMIRHKTVGTEREGMLGGDWGEQFEEPASDARGAEIGDAVAGAKSQEVGAVAEVVLSREADGLVEAGGGHW